MLSGKKVHFTTLLAVKEIPKSIYCFSFLFTATENMYKKHKKKMYHSIIQMYKMQNIYTFVSLKVFEFMLTKECFSI